MNVMVQMATSKLDPAYSVIRKFDTAERKGSFVLSQRLGLARSAVTKWTLPRERSGTGGHIPPRYYADILAFAREVGVQLDPSEFVIGPVEVEHARASA